MINIEQVCGLVEKGLGNVPGSGVIDAHITRSTPDILFADFTDYGDGGKVSKYKITIDTVYQGPAQDITKTFLRNIANRIISQGEFTEEACNQLLQAVDKMNIPE